MPRGRITGDGPAAPPTGPVVGKVAQSHLAANAHGTVFALHGTLDTSRGERIACVQARGDDARDVPGAVRKADTAMLDQHGAESVRAVDAPHQPWGGKVVPVPGGTAQTLDVAELEEAEYHDLQLVGEGHESSRFLLGCVEGGPDAADIRALAVAAPSPQLLREARGGGAGLDVEFAPRGRQRLGDGDDGLADGLRDAREAWENAAGAAVVVWRVGAVVIHDA